MNCPRCQHENPPAQKFCGECGARLTAACPACGASNPPEQKFCGECGSSLVVAPASRFTSPQQFTPKHLADKILTGKAAVEGERKRVTVLFADLKGSMELLADRDPEEARKLLDPVLEKMMEAVHHYEGTVNQVMGDGIMALFGAPLAHETTPCGLATPRYGCKSASSATRRRRAMRTGSTSRCESGSTPAKWWCAPLGAFSTWTTPPLARPRIWRRGWSNSPVPAAFCSRRRLWS